MWPPKSLQPFPRIYPCHLQFDLKRPNFNLVQDIIKSEILTKIHEHWIENVASTVSRFSQVLFLRITFESDTN